MEIKINEKEKKYQFKDIKPGECFAVGEKNQIFVKTEDYKLKRRRPDMRINNEYLWGEDDKLDYFDGNAISITDGTMAYVLGNAEIKPISKIEVYIGEEEEEEDEY